MRETSMQLNPVHEMVSVGFTNKRDDKLTRGRNTGRRWAFVITRTSCDPTAEHLSRHREVTGDFHGQVHETRMAWKLNRKN